MLWIIAMYTIIHVDKNWIVCTSQGELFIFDRNPGRVASRDQRHGAHAAML